MKILHKNILIILSAVTIFTACSDDELSDQSIINVPTSQQTTQFDKWLTANYVETYNIDFKYRYDDIEADMNYYTIPAKYDESVIMAHLVKYLCLETYDEVAGVTFTRSYFPKMIFLIGEFEYQNNGTMILGTAEGGKKILLTGVNYLSSYLDDAHTLNEYYFKTIHHEFTHILNQTKEYSTDFGQVTGSGYVADSWSEEPYDTEYLKNGFITAYAQHSDTEDFAEMLSTYICNTPEQWQAWMEKAGEEPAQKIAQKLSIVRQYMLNSWNIDIDELRSSIMMREDIVTSGKLNFTDLTVK